jgi:PilZ domain
MDKRPEFRVSADIPVRIWGMDADGRPFFQSAIASNLSTAGAQLSRVHHSLKVGEIIGIQYGDVKARCRVVWMKPSVALGHNEAGVQILAQQPVPWGEVTAENRPEKSSVQRESNRRKFTRHKVQFPLAISFPDNSRAHMQCNATDMGGRGCYVETLVPLSVGTQVIVTFWIDSEKLKTDGVVRASDPGVGMGIEFTSLEAPIQQRLQEYLQKMDEGFASAASQSS